MSGNVKRFRNLFDALWAAPSERLFVTQWVDEDEQHTLTFGEFLQGACRQASFLNGHGVGRGDRVVVIMPQNISAMTTFVGTMMLGAAPAFLALPNFKVEAAKYRAGLAGVTANLKAKIVVIDDEFPGEMLEHVSLGEQAQLVRADSGNGGNVRPSDEAGYAWDVGREIDSYEIAFVQHSAGTTGLQKGVALTHSAVLRQLEHLAQKLKVDGATDSIYSWLPLYHDMGLIACFMLPMVCHIPVVMQSPLDWVMHPETMLEIITQHKCSLAWMPNFAFQFVPRRTSKSRWAQYDLSSVRAVINCSEPVRSASMAEFERAFAGSGLRPGVMQCSYAMAENVFAVTQTDLARPSGPSRICADAHVFRTAHRIVPVNAETAGAVAFTSSGKALDGNEIQIASETGAILEDGRVGEILIKSDSLFSGYYNRPDLTAQAIVDGWYHSGDLGFLLEEELYVVGRKKDLLIVGGENLYPQDIEEIVGAHPAIHDGRAVALGLYNADLGTEDVVVVAEVEREELLPQAGEIEREIRSAVVSGLGVAVRTIFLKAPKWIVKSTAGKAARSATREKLLREHPELSVEREEAHSA